MTLNYLYKRHSLSCQKFKFGIVKIKHLFATFIIHFFNAGAKILNFQTMLSVD